MNRTIRPRVRHRRRVWLLKSCHVWRLGLKSPDRGGSGELVLVASVVDLVRGLRTLMVFLWLV